MKNLAIVIAVAGVILVSQNVDASVIINDSFDDGDITTNTSGVGSGFNVFENAGATTSDNSGGASGAQLSGGTGGASRTSIASIETFDANSATAVTGTFSLSDFGRSASFNSNTTRLFVGFNEGNASNTGVLENRLDGLWVALQSNEIAAGADNGEGALFYVDGTTVTNLQTWTWDQSLVNWDSASTFRSDRISTDLLAPLTLELTSDATGYSLNFATSGSGVLPANIAGTWAGAGVTNDLTSVRASAFLQGDRGNLELSNITVESATAIPEPASFALLGLSSIGLIVRRRRS